MSFADLPVGGAGTWAQSYDPMGHWWLTTLIAAVPLVLLLALMLGIRMKAHRASLIALAALFVVAVGLFHMPVKLAGLATGYGIAYGLFPIAWIVFPVIFMYELTVHAKRFELLQQCFQGVTQDARLQLLLIAFALGAFFEGAAGFGTPVAVCGTLLIGIGFAPLEAAALALLANTAPVAFGGLGTPVVALHGVTGLDIHLLSRMIGVLLTPFCVLVPFWLIAVFAGWKRMLEVWPAILLSGVLFGGVQLLVASFHGPWLVNIVASVVTIAAQVMFFRVWRPRRIIGTQLEDVAESGSELCRPSRSLVMRAMMPWAILTLFVALWGTPLVGHWLGSFSTMMFPIRGLDKVVLRMPPVVPALHAEAAVFTFDWLAATGTGIFIAAWVAAFVMGLKVRETLGVLRLTLWKTRHTIITIGALMGFGFLMRFCGLDGVLGLAFVKTGALYAFFGTLIGWIGTAATGSDTSSNVLFGSLQKLTALQLGIPAVVMAAANSGGGVMGKMIAPQSVVVASTAAGIYGSEGVILRRVVLHSLALASLMGVTVLVALHVPAIVRLAAP
ncbi:L-lactate permease [Granulicella sp. 5B5]|uniref:L-lactate permease n=1 Tax=Granulicella sp. 5B5 TaxID=1617967 RepID=UPI0015F559B6|nr:L-lactate permease [Granulicella sp. 5B5]QMV17940.1 L-lactate permease [Granulicella sp. 5B5]